MFETDHQTLVRWRQAIDRRKSVRRFTGEPLDPRTVRALGRVCTGCTHLPGGRVRVVPVDGRDAARRVFRWLPGGIATFIHGASLTFVILSSGLPHDPEDAGFCGEQVVLEACSLNVGTCWVSGTFSRKAALSLAGAAQGQHVVCVIAAGSAGPATASRHKRKKSFGQVCGTPPDALPPWIGDAINCARVAPSGINRQPWWFEVRDGVLHKPEVVLWPRKPAPDFPGVTFPVLAAGPRRIDHGIAMLHFSVGAAFGGVNGRWSLGDGIGRPAVARFSMEGQGFAGRKIDPQGIE